MELQELLKSNDTYPDTPEGRRETQREANDRASQPFEYQSSSAYDRLDNLNELWEKRRIRFRLVPLFQTNRAQFDREFTFLQEQLPLMRQRIVANQAEIDAYVYRRKPISHRAYTFFTRASTSHNAQVTAHDRLQDNTRNLTNLVRQVEKQLAVYEEILTEQNIPAQAAQQVAHAAANDMDPQPEPEPHAAVNEDPLAPGPHAAAQAVVNSNDPSPALRRNNRRTQRKQRTQKKQRTQTRARRSRRS
jgi:DNA polymerase III gamma/tau subunit